MMTRDYSLLATRVKERRNEDAFHAEEILLLIAAFESLQERVRTLESENADILLRLNDALQYDDKASKAIELNARLIESNLRLRRLLSDRPKPKAPKKKARNR
jgi:hypothetical protein